MSLLIEFTGDMYDSVEDLFMIFGRWVDSKLGWIQIPYRLLAGNQCILGGPYFVHKVFAVITLR